MYTTTISIGNPPTRFRAQVDTSWGPVFVPSVNCENVPCWMHYENMYNSGNSSTYSPNGTACQVGYWGQYGLWTKGNISQDNIHIGNMEVRNQEFEEVTHWIPSELEREDLYDTVLGLSLRDIDDRWTTFRAPSLFQSMVRQQLLKDGLFALRLSRTDAEVGELILGGIPEEIKSAGLIDIPLTRNFIEERSNDQGGGPDDKDDDIMRFYASGGWQVAIRNITVIGQGWSSSPIAILPKNYTAVISTSFPWIGVPFEVADEINQKLGLEEFMNAVNCDKRRTLPNITFHLGPSSKEIILTPWDYLIEVYNDARQELTCASPFWGREEEDLRGFLILGSPFLNGLYSVWDADRETLSFANRIGHDGDVAGVLG
ncbi:acid protease [Lojkania enalia]|uniref:Acid protease n=1 Tax=Lojkania enalia TaxID=147567 RepID=A0A9P4K9Q0_9PLEO|nr:acid protease [Didymosphaeria enalia]